MTKFSQFIFILTVSFILGTFQSLLSSQIEDYFSFGTSLTQCVFVVGKYFFDLRKDIVVIKSENGRTNERLQFGIGR